MEYRNNITKNFIDKWSFLITTFKYNFKNINNIYDILYELTTVIHKNTMNVICEKYLSKFSIALAVINELELFHINTDEITGFYLNDTINNITNLKHMVLEVNSKLDFYKKENYSDKEIVRSLSMYFISNITQYIKNDIAEKNRD